MGQRKKTDKPAPDNAEVDEQEESSTAEQDVEPSDHEDSAVSSTQQSNQSSPRKRRTKADLDVSFIAAVGYVTYGNVIC